MPINPLIRSPCTSTCTCCTCCTKTDTIKTYFTPLGSGQHFRFNFCPFLGIENDSVSHDGSSTCTCTLYSGDPRDNLTCMHTYKTCITHETEWRDMKNHKLRVKCLNTAIHHHFCPISSFFANLCWDNPLLQSIYAHCTRTASAAIPCIFIVEDENAPGRKKRWEEDTAKVIWGPGDQWFGFLSTWVIMGENICLKQIHIYYICLTFSSVLFHMITCLQYYSLQPKESPLTWILCYSNKYLKDKLFVFQYFHHLWARPGYWAIWPATAVSLLNSKLVSTHFLCVSLHTIMHCIINCKYYMNMYWTCWTVHCIWLCTIGQYFTLYYIQ